MAKGQFREETRSALDGGGVPTHTKRAIPGPEASPNSCTYGCVVVDQVVAVKPGSFCRLLGLEKIPENLSEFLDYFWCAR